MSLEEAQARVDRWSGGPLDLSNLGLIDVPPAISRLTAVTNLNLGGNRLTRVPDAVVELGGLVSLHLHSNRLVELPDTLPRLTNLTSLYLGRNRLTQVPDSIDKLMALQVLDLGRNELTVIPESITRLENLRVLDLSRNQLSTLPETISHLETLVELHLCGNELERLPEGITRLTRLTKLDLDSNRLTRLPPQLAALDGLTAVRLNSDTVADGELALGVGNRFPTGLLDAASLGIEELWSYLTSSGDIEHGGDDYMRAALADDDRPLTSYAADLHFRGLLPAGEAVALRRSLERLIGLASLAIEDGLLNDEPLVLEQVVADRNFLQSELTRSPELHSAVVVALVQRLSAHLLRLVPTDAATHDLALARELASVPDDDPTDPRAAAQRAESIALALEATAGDPPGTSTWRAWLARRLGWTNGVAKDAAAGGGGLVGGAELAELLGASGPADIIVGGVVAVLATVFRRTTADDTRS